MTLSPTHMIVTFKPGTLLFVVSLFRRSGGAEVLMGEYEGMDPAAVHRLILRDHPTLYVGDFKVEDHTFGATKHDWYRWPATPLKAGPEGVHTNVTEGLKTLKGMLTPTWPRVKFLTCLGMGLGLLYSLLMFAMYGMAMLKLLDTGQTLMNNIALGYVVWYGFLSVILTLFTWYLSGVEE